jgi:hypothetical protein
MATVAPSFVQVHPNFTMPEIVLQYNQASGAFDLLASGNPLVRLGEGDKYVYIKAMDIRTKVAAGQSASNNLPSVSITPRMISTPTYLIRTRAEYDHHDTAAFGQWGASLPEAQRLGMRQGIFQQTRNALLYGFNATNGEGLLNTNGATAVSLPADTYGNTTVLTYDNGQMAQFLLTQVQAIKTRMMQMGMPAQVTIIGPQRTLGVMEYQGIVQLVQFQRQGAGSETTKGTLENILERNNDDLIWNYDDTLIGKGAGGTDAVLIVVPEVKKPKVNDRVNTNVWAELRPGLEATVLQLCDMAAPREIPTPLAGGAIDVLSEMRVTSGWAPRPEAVTIVSMQYQ